MATNIKASDVYDRLAELYYNADALGASVTTAVVAFATQKQGLGARARGKDIGHFVAEYASGSTPNFALKVQDSDGPPTSDPHQAESSWRWEDLVSFTALTGAGGGIENVEATRPIKRYLRMVLTRTGGTVTGLRVGYKYRQVGPRHSGLVLPGPTS